MATVFRSHTVPVAVVPAMVCANASMPPGAKPVNSAQSPIDDTGVPELSQAPAKIQVHRFEPDDANPSVEQDKPDFLLTVLFSVPLLRSSYPDVSTYCCPSPFERFTRLSEFRTLSSPPDPLLST